jgi:transcriptional regulator with XRE-family HTH domain
MNDPKATQWLTKAGGIARRLTQARGDRSGLSLADELGWSSSKITRIEQGTQIPKSEDVKKWAAATGLNDGETVELLRLLDEFTAVHSVMRRRSKRPEPVQTDINSLVDTATLIRSYSLWAVPAILQLPEYATAVLQAQQVIDPDSLLDVSESVDGRMRRQPLLYDPTRRFEILIDEGVLYRAHGGVDVLRAQLDRLVPLTRMPKLRFGIVPFRAQAWGGQSIVMFDERAFTEQMAGAVAVPEEWLDSCTRIIEQLWSAAAEGARARRLLLAAIAGLDD